MEQEMSIRERVLRTSLRLFATKGFLAVSADEICKEAGLRKFELYSEFENRHEIFDQIMKDISANYDLGFKKMNFHPEDVELDIELFTRLNEDEMIEMAQNFFKLLVHDEFMSQSRRLLTVEQYKSEEISKFYNEHYIFDLINYMDSVFEMLIDLQLIEDYNSHAMATEFIAPLEVWLGVVDRQPELEDIALKSIAYHIRQFRHIYGTFE